MANLHQTLNRVILNLFQDLSEERIFSKLTQIPKQVRNDFFVIVCHHLIKIEKSFNQKIISYGEYVLFSVPGGFKRNWMYH